ncbi:MAG: hypothetical protein ACREK2_08200 [Gemmatimonadota bacterium]
MTPEQRLRKAFELSEMGRELFRQGLRQRHPDLALEDFKALLRKRLILCQERRTREERRIGQMMSRAVLVSGSP